MSWTNGLWTFSGQSKKGAGGHPAPFPLELPKRCNETPRGKLRGINPEVIKLFSFVGDTVLDPFMGSGSTIIASYLNRRKSIGVDIDQSYCKIAVERLKQEASIKG